MEKNLSIRMKEYEETYNIRLPIKLPVIIRLDGKSFSKLTKSLGLQKPFDLEFITLMAEVTKSLAENIQGCIFGYTQSDEITLVLRNDQSELSEAWFDNRIQKICSVVASMATAFFNGSALIGSINSRRTSKLLYAIFDARIFVVPNIEEAIKSLIWRQLDCIKNSVNTATYYEVGKKVGRGTARTMMYGLRKQELKELLLKETGIIWSDYPDSIKYGMTTHRVKENFKINDHIVERNPWKTFESWRFFGSEDLLINIFEGKENV